MKLYIIHGWTYSLDKWAELLDELRRRGIEPVMLKVPGLAEPSDQVWDVERYKAWLAEQLRGVEAPVLLGHSNGGRIAMAYAQANPGAFKRLILMDSAGVAHPEKQGRLSLINRIARTGRVFAKLPLVGKVFYKLIGASDYHNAPANMKRTMQNMLDADATIDPTKIAVPVTLIWGEADKATPLSDAQTLERALPKAELHVLPGAGHSPQGSHPQQVADLIEKALA